MGDIALMRSPLFRRSHLKGLCGNMDGTSLDDLTNSCGQDVSGLQEDAGRAMAESWQVEDVTHDLAK